MSAISAELATNSELAARIGRQVREIRERHKKLGASNTVDIYRGESKPKFRVTNDGVLVYARSNRKVNCAKLGHNDLTAIWERLGDYLGSI